MFALHILYNHLPQTWVRFTVKYFGDIFSGISAPNVTSIAEATKRLSNCVCPCVTYYALYRTHARSMPCPRLYCLV